MLSVFGNQIQNKLSRNTLLFCLYAIVTACSTYAFMYGFRKPIAVGLYADTTILGLTLKTLYLTAQIVGYALSKFIGIKVIAELQNHGRAKTILALIFFGSQEILAAGGAPCGDYGECDALSLSLIIWSHCNWVLLLLSITVMVVIH